MKNDDLLEYLEERLACLDAAEDTVSYIISVFHAMNTSPDKDLSDVSVVLAYSAALQSGAFEGFQVVADWCLWASVYVPESLDSPDLIFDIGMKSYDACDRIVLKTWPCFNELSLRLPEIVYEARRSVFRQLTP